MAKWIDIQRTRTARKKLWRYTAVHQSILICKLFSSFHGFALRDFFFFFSPQKAFGRNYCLKLVQKKNNNLKLRRTPANRSFGFQPLDPAWFTDRKMFRASTQQHPLKRTHYFKEECDWALRDLSKLNWNSLSPTKDTCSLLSLGKDFLLDINYYPGSLFSFSTVPKHCSVIGLSH